MTQKVQVSQDTLYQYMQAHDIKMTRLAELIGKSDDVVTSCFKHHKDVHGNPRRFNARNIAAINQALPQIADELRSRLLKFGSDQVFTNSWGNTYDPALIDTMNDLGKYLNITGLVGRILGWKKGKKSAVFCQPSSKAYGAISESDVVAINNELLSVAGVLSSYEVVADEGSSSSDAETKEQKTINKCTRTRVEDSFASNVQPWDDTSLSLQDRYRHFHDRWSEGILFFRVNDGYTVAQDDSRRVSALDSTLSAYTDPASGLTTTYMPSETFEKVLPVCVAKGWRIVITNMYSEK